MSSYIRIWIHYIWATKYRRKIITRDIKFLLYDHIRANAEEKDIYIDHINGTEDHIHLLVSLKGHQCPSKIVFYIKGE